VAEQVVLSSEMIAANPAPHSSTVVALTTTDALKAAALLIILIDHIGHYLADDWPLLRVIGRLGAPIFFFLIGFARTRAVPLRWLWLGALLTGVDYLWVGSLSETQLNILFNFALIRLGLSGIERWADTSSWLIILLALACLPLLPVINPWLEYGSEGWLFALFGLSQRIAIERGTGNDKALAALTVLIALVAYSLVEAIDYDFSPWHAGLMSLLIAGLGLALWRFRRAALNWRTGPGMHQLIQLCGRYSLEIYAAQIILLAAIGGLWSTLEPENGAEDDDDN
jgi:hypothetical protein